MDTKPFSPDEFKYIFAKATRLTVLVTVINSQGILLTLRDEPSWHNQWHLPGGTVLYKETLHAAVKRVAHEEIGLEVSIKRLLGYVEYPSEEKERGFGWAIGLSFLCEAKPGKITLDKQASDAQYFDTLPHNMVNEEYEFINKIGIDTLKK